MYSFNPRDRAASYQVNVTGTAGLLEAAYLAGVERCILTSSSATLGHSHGDRPADERDYALEDPSDAYHHSKLLQERAAFASRLPVVAILPTAPIGANDWKPTPTGNMILEYARGKMFAKPPGHGGMNLVAVEDVARAHIAALTRGRINERYVIGGENLTMDAIWETLATITGIPAPERRAPYGLALAVAYADRIRCTVTPHADTVRPAGRRAHVPRQDVRQRRKSPHRTRTHANPSPRRPRTRRRLVPAERLHSRTRERKVA